MYRDELCETILTEIKGGEFKAAPTANLANLLRARNLLWENLKAGKTGMRFAKGFSESGGFRSGAFYDFICNKGQLTIDVGTNRGNFSVEQYLFSKGQRTAQFNHLYFTPEEVIRNTIEVIQKIKNELHR